MDTQPTDVQVTADPFAGDFALCLSGGGYRAAAFHLGVLDVLTRLGLADRLRTLSTISGGTIVGAAYALSLSRGEPFDAFYARFYETLRTRNVVREAFARLHDHPDGQGRGEAQQQRVPSLIRAAAAVYADPAFVGDATLGDLADSPAVPDELVFSATEFRSGCAFRFQTSRRAPGYVGNSDDLKVPDPLWRQIRLADAVAASSCFPIAFEPILFPDDFTWDVPLPGVRDALGDDYPAPLALMDGGVFDNQGVDGVQTVYNRRALELGWLMVSDTSPRRGSRAFHAPEAEGRAKGKTSPGLRLKWVPWLAAILLVAAVLSFGALAVDAGRAILTRGLDPLHDAFVYGVPILLSLAAIGTVAFAGLKARDLLRFAQRATDIDPWPTLREIGLRDLVYLVRDRLGSFTALTKDVFMKRIRGLVQDALYEAGLRNRVAQNLIYDLDRNRRLYDEHPALTPTPALVELARRAESVGTTLWLDREDDLRDLVACGQATTCFTVLEFIAEEYGYGSSAYSDGTPTDTATGADGRGEGHALATHVLTLAEPLWERLKRDPAALLRDNIEAR